LRERTQPFSFDELDAGGLYRAIIRVLNGSAGIFRISSERGGLAKSAAVGRKRPGNGGCAKPLPPDGRYRTGEPALRGGPCAIETKHFACRKPSETSAPKIQQKQCVAAKLPVACRLGGQL